MLQRVETKGDRKQIYSLRYICGRCGHEQYRGPGQKDSPCTDCGYTLKSVDYHGFPFGKHNKENL